jgi:hypothetical protein
VNNDSRYKVSSLSVCLEQFIGLCREFDGCAKVMGTSAVFRVKEIMEGVMECVVPSTLTFWHRNLAFKF